MISFTALKTFHAFSRKLPMCQLLARYELKSLSQTCSHLRIRGPVELKFLICTYSALTELYLVSKTGNENNITGNHTY